MIFKIINNYIIGKIVHGYIKYKNNSNIFLFNLKLINFNKDLF